ncbi:MAG: hypothetical protein AVDCRST_MAG67-4489 [uncultured Solirubrobacteraceae bacterium]|uniref:DUF1905 domain-containing protein n=1 Tax=uncultured Solirubrobacteraceae bacterium TaxID=1162706 RepID=A0A6J4TVR0_9ACTN|nr:MAG: hypothetical protein AVDCRST_MAG67-4489 [uncultured Solirubrobacteraceae bacterium]
MEGVCFARVQIPQGQVTATMFEAPVDMRATFGRARPPLLVTVNGHTYRTTPGACGGRAYVPLNQTNRAAAGVQAGDEIEVVLALDTEPRTVDVPDDLAAALAVDAIAQERFAAMSYSHPREYVDWIEEAKRPQTCARRIGRASSGCAAVTVSVDAGRARRSRRWRGLVTTSCPSQERVTFRRNSLDTPYDLSDERVGAVTRRCVLRGVHRERARYDELRSCRWRRM